tara:strand:- start:2284 stop:2895 length:612 start_codon:yes stop_codon:yes gene_type:complete
MNAVRESVEGAIAAGVQILTLFAFSTENWNRPPQEVSALMQLLQHYARREGEELRKRGVEVHVLGELDRVDSATRRAIETITDSTRGGITLRLNLMISYGGREELVRAARILSERVRAGELDPDEINEDELQKTLFTRDVREPDLLIRTSGEFRISNFMLWQLAYTELHITRVLWPDFGREDFFEAILEYQNRDRRFGSVRSQ